MRIIWFVLLLCAICNLNISGQVQPNEPLTFYGDVMVNASSAENRLFAHDIFYDLFSKEMNSENSWQRDFTELPWISVQYPSDRSFRIISWQLKKSNDAYEYFGFIQNESVTKPLVSTVEYKKEIGYSNLNFDEYFGGLVYNIEQVDLEGKTQYLVFSLTQLDAKHKVKSVFSIADMAILPKPFITDANSIRSRDKSIVCVKYSATANASVAYNSEMNTIVYDHIISTIPNSNDGNIYQIPDGSYEGYEWKSGKGWVYNANPFEELEQEFTRSNSRKKSSEKPRRRRKK